MFDFNKLIRELSVKNEVKFEFNNSVVEIFVSDSGGFNVNRFDNVTMDDCIDEDGNFEPKTDPDDGGRCIGSARDAIFFSLSDDVTIQSPLPLRNLEMCEENLVDICIDDLLEESYLGVLFGKTSRFDSSTPKNINGEFFNSVVEYIKLNISDAVNTASENELDSCEEWEEVEYIPEEHDILIDNRVKELWNEMIKLGN